jgi:hypothetical protein
VSPKSRLKDIQDFVEDGFTKDFEVMYSKNNHHRHPLKREYFDKPVNYIHKGFLFTPSTVMPLDLYHNGDSHYNVKIKSEPFRNATSKTMLAMRKDGMDTLTTGIPDHSLFNKNFHKPK